MPDDFKNLAGAAFSKLSEKSNLDDLEKVASIAKYTAEAQKAEIEAQNARSTIWGGLGKNLPNIVVPLASLAAVVTTFWIQSNQVSLSRQQLEDTQWREFLESVNKSPNSAISDVTFVPRLKSFLHSNVYNGQVVDVAKRLLGQLTDRAGFDELFGVVFPEDSDVSLDDMKDVLNSLQRTDIAIQITCNPTDQAYQALQIPVRLSQWGLCDGGITDQQVLDYLKSYPGKDKIIQAKRDSYTTADEEYDVTRRILSIVREVLAKNKGTHINLAGLHFQWGDFTGIDFSEIDLTDTFFERCNFTGAVFDSTKISELQSKQF